MKDKKSTKFRSIQDDNLHGEVNSEGKYVRTYKTHKNTSPLEKLGFAGLDQGMCSETYHTCQSASPDKELLNQITDQGVFERSSSESDVFVTCENYENNSLVSSSAAKQACSSKHELRKKMEIHPQKKLKNYSTSGKGSKAKNCGSDSSLKRSEKEGKRKEGKKIKKHQHNLEPGQDDTGSATESEEELNSSPPVSENAGMSYNKEDTLNELGIGCDASFEQYLFDMFVENSQKEIHPKNRENAVCLSSSSDSDSSCEETVMRRTQSNNVVCAASGQSSAQEHALKTNRSAYSSEHRLRKGTDASDAQQKMSGNSKTNAVCLSSLSDCDSSCEETVTRKTQFKDAMCVSGQPSALEHTLKSSSSAFGSEHRLRKGTDATCAPQKTSGNSKMSAVCLSSDSGSSCEETITKSTCTKDRLSASSQSLVKHQVSADGSAFNAHDVEHRLPDCSGDKSFRCAASLSAESSCRNLVTSQLRKSESSGETYKVLPKLTKKVHRRIELPVAEVSDSAYGSPFSDESDEHKSNKNYGLAFTEYKSPSGKHKKKQKDIMSNIGSSGNTDVRETGELANIADDQSLYRRTSCTSETSAINDGLLENEVHLEHNSPSEQYVDCGMSIGTSCHQQGSQKNDVAVHNASILVSEDSVDLLGMDCNLLSELFSQNTATTVEKISEKRKTSCSPVTAQFSSTDSDDSQSNSYKLTWGGNNPAHGKNDKRLTKKYPEQSFLKCCGTKLLDFVMEDSPLTQDESVLKPWSQTSDNSVSLLGKAPSQKQPLMNNMRKSQDCRSDKNSFDRGGCSSTQNAIVCSGTDVSLADVGSADNSDCTTIDETSFQKIDDFCVVTSFDSNKSAKINDSMGSYLPSSTGANRINSLSPVTPSSCKTSSTKRRLEFESPFTSTPVTSISSKLYAVSVSSAAAEIKTSRSCDRSVFRNVSGDSGTCKCPYSKDGRKSPDPFDADRNDCNWENEPLATHIVSPSARCRKRKRWKAQYEGDCESRTDCTKNQTAGDKSGSVSSTSASYRSAKKFKRSDGVCDESRSEVRKSYSDVEPDSPRRNSLVNKTLQFQQNMEKPRNTAGPTRDMTPASVSCGDAKPASPDLFEGDVIAADTNECRPPSDSGKARRVLFNPAEQPMFDVTDSETVVSDMEVTEAINRKPAHTFKMKLKLLSHADKGRQNSDEEDSDSEQGTSDTSETDSDSDMDQANNIVKKASRSRKYKDRRQPKQSELDKKFTPADLEKLHAVNSVHYLRTVQKVRESGLSHCCRFGNWTDEELCQLQRNWNVIMTDCPITDHSRLFLTNRQCNNDVKEFIKSSDFYIKLADDIPRTLYAVYLKARKMLPKLDSNFQKVDCQSPTKLQPGKKKKVVRHYQWSEAEIELLRKTVRRYLDKHPGNKLDWPKIARRIPDRNRKQCRHKWLTLATEDVVEFPRAEKIRLIEEILASGVQEEANIDWNTLYQKFSYLPSVQYLRGRFFQLKARQVPKHLKFELKAYLSYLKEAYSNLEHPKRSRNCKCKDRRLYT